MIIGVDVGYGYTKAMAENGESLVFPSVVGTGFERKLNKLIPSGVSEADNYDLIINGDEPQHYFVGNLAILHSPTQLGRFRTTGATPKKLNRHC